MKKALSTMICTLVMLCFGFVAVALQIDVPVVTARTYKTTVAVPDTATTVPDNDFDLEAYLICENTDEDHTHNADCYDLTTAIPSDAPTVEYPEYTGDIDTQNDGIAVEETENTSDDDSNSEAAVVPVDPNPDEGKGEEITTTDPETPSTGDEGEVKGDDNITTDPVDSHEHNYVEVKVDATCTEDAYTYTKCDVDGCDYATEPEVIEGTAGHIEYDVNGKCIVCGAEDTNEDNWNIETTPFNEYILGLVKLDDKITGIWRMVLEVGAIMTFAIAAFILGLIIKAGSKKGGTPKAPKVKKGKKSKKSADTPATTGYTPRVRW